MYNIIYLPKANKDLLEIVRYISLTLNNPTAANNFTEQVNKSIGLLSEMPYMCPVHKTVSSNNHKYQYRKLIVKNYIVFYRIEEEPEKTVTISRVLYAGRDFRNTLN